MAEAPAIETVQETIQVDDVKPQIALSQSQANDPSQNLLFTATVSDYIDPSESQVHEENVTVSSDSLHYVPAPSAYISPDGDASYVVSGDGDLVMAAAEAASSATHQTTSQVEIELPPDTPQCMICSDKGTGYHYSVFSCEGCKGFFKRSVQKNLNYMCKENQNCVINRATRNNCQYCRFRKCIEAGMKKEAVRDDRTPGGKQKNKKMRLDDDTAIMSTILSQVVCDSQDDQLIQAFVDAKPDLAPNAENSEIRTDSEGRAVDVDINDLMQYGYMELRLIIEWARKVPGFSDLLIEDQMALLKGSFMELNVLRLAYRSLDADGSVKFAHGLVMSPQHSTNLGWGSDLLNCSIEFISKLKEISIDHVEFCILSAIVLTYPDATGIKDRHSVINLQNKILDCFRKNTTRTYPNDPHRYARILLRLPALRTVSAIAAERFLSMSLEGNIKMNALVLEMMS